MRASNFHKGWLQRSAFLILILYKTKTLGASIWGNPSTYEREKTGIVDPVVSMDHME